MSSGLRTRDTYPFFTRLLMAVVSVPTVTDTAFATVDMFLGSLMPMASMICMSLMEISLKLPVISARFSISSTSLNSITSRSFKSFSFSMHPSPPRGNSSASQYIIRKLADARAGHQLPLRSSW